ncbi:hypothetical protein CC78DRAFT_572905 [Lojkania enalia]|uniref:RRN7-type domain-containing protein n=1 Tax=Lojkania enalia TaxID=147567 RepID=A0A9P4MX43_9PLEO|nr:hypothetical protein CC78DRAFT_572905 [Didymosphaeria enalia]
MMNTGRTKGPVCGVENCRSRWYDEGEDGYLYCENGHRKGGLVVGEDEDDWSAMPRARTRHKKDSDEDEKTYKYYRGHQAFDHYLKCYQLILRHQVWFLVHEKGLPEELEGVISDLWTLRILKLNAKVAPIDGYDLPSQAFSSAQSDIESGNELFGAKRRNIKLKATPGLIDSLALCYLGIITLRLPVTPGDICKWTIDDSMPYQRAIQLLPLTMRGRLPPAYHAVLDPNSLLKLERFFSAIVDLSTAFQKEYGIIWPSLNSPLLIFRYLKELALPLELYDTTTRLASYLGYNFAFPTSVNGIIGIRNLPEAQLVACLVICVKVVYPFDGQQQYPRTTSEPAATTIDWEDWYKQISLPKMEQQGSSSKYTPEALANMQEQDIFSMSEDQLDQYLDWYQDTFIDEARIRQGGDGDFQSALYDMFPIDRTRPSKASNDQSERSTNQDMEIIKAVHGNMRPRTVIRDHEGQEHIVRPGQRYKYYRKKEDLPEHAKRFYERAAKIAGLSLDMLIKAVFFAEQKVEKWRDKRRRWTGSKAIVLG